MVKFGFLGFFWVFGVFEVYMREVGGFFGCLGKVILKVFICFVVFFGFWRKCFVFFRVGWDVGKRYLRV